VLNSLVARLDLLCRLLSLRLLLLSSSSSISASGLSLTDFRTLNMFVTMASFVPASSVRSFASEATTFLCCMSLVNALFGTSAFDSAGSSMTSALDSAGSSMTSSGPSSESLRMTLFLLGPLSSRGASNIGDKGGTRCRGISQSIPSSGCSTDGKYEPASAASSVPSSEMFTTSTEHL